VCLVDNLVQILRTMAETDDPHIAWKITNNGVVIGVRASSIATFDDPDAAFAEARRMLRKLTDDGRHRLVNRADIGVNAEPIEGHSAWRGTIDLLLWPADNLDGNHHVIESY